MTSYEKQRSSNRPAPPLPPRTSSSRLTPNAEAPPPYSLIDANSQSQSYSLSANDPRNASTDSLVPVESGRGRRKLLLVYIHGFMGNETSFRSFPAHVHNLLSITLADTHVVHTKIYPRYRSRRTIDFARDEFSKWYDALHSRQHELMLSIQACSSRVAGR